MTIDAQLLVWLKGTDLFATTAYLTLVGKMGYGDRVVGIKRFDHFRFEVAGGSRAVSSAQPEGVVAALKGVLDRQSTFYNRNKHLYSLRCNWGDSSQLEGPETADIRRRWIGEISKTLQNQRVADLGGKYTRDQGIFNEFKGFLAEVWVEEEDPSARESVAARLRGGLGGVEVSCTRRATLWWLALCVPSREEAAALAKEIAVTARRDNGLLMNPNYQRADFGSVTEF